MLPFESIQGLHTLAIAVLQELLKKESIFRVACVAEDCWILLSILGNSVPINPQVRVFFGEFGESPCGRESDGLLVWQRRRQTLRICWHKLAIVGNATVVANTLIEACGVLAEQL